MISDAGMNEFHRVGSAAEDSEDTTPSERAAPRFAWWHPQSSDLGRWEAARRAHVRRNDRWARPTRGAEEPRIVRPAPPRAPSVFAALGPAFAPVDPPTPHALARRVQAQPPAPAGPPPSTAAAAGATKPPRPAAAAAARDGRRARFYHGAPGAGLVEGASAASSVMAATAARAFCADRLRTGLVLVTSMSVCSFKLLISKDNLDKLSP